MNRAAPSRRDWTALGAALLSGAVTTGLVILCVRFGAAALRSAEPFPWPTLLLLAAGLGLGWGWSEAGPLAFVAAVPLLNGLEVSTLLRAGAAANLVCAGLVVGRAARRLRRRGGGGRPKSHLLAADLLLAAVLVSAAVQCWIRRQRPDVAEALFSSASPGFGSPWYFLAATLTWAQGLFLFRCLGERQIRIREIHLIVTAWLAATACFYWLQVASGAPALFAVYVFHPEYHLAHFAFAPFEDIHSLGSVCVALLGYLLGSWPTRNCPPRPRGGTALRAAAGILFLALAAASWSRGTWLALLVMLLLLGAMRLPARVSLPSLAAALGAWAAAYFGASWPIWRSNPYLFRLISLLHLRGDDDKMLGRLALYRRALAMIRDRPWFGHGIGSFYLGSVPYAPPGDPETGLPNFAHDCILQLSAEMGLPVAMLFAGGIVWLTWRGLRQPGQPRDCEADGLALALVGYLLTQITSNSLNIYASNQFLFWFLAAALAERIADLRLRPVASEAEAKGRG